MWGGECSVAHGCRRSIQYPRRLSNTAGLQWFGLRFGTGAARELTSNSLFLKTFEVKGGGEKMGRQQVLNLSKKKKQQVWIGKQPWQDGTVFILVSSGSFCEVLYWYCRLLTSPPHEMSAHQEARVCTSVCVLRFPNVTAIGTEGQKPSLSCWSHSAPSPPSFSSARFCR